MPSFYETLRAAGYTDCTGIIQADEYEPGSWIFIADEFDAYSVNIFTNGDFAGVPLREFEYKDDAKLYVAGWLAANNKGGMEMKMEELVG